MILNQIKTASKLSYSQKENLPDSAFAAVYKDPETGEKVRKYPIHDEEHVRNALARFAQHKNELPPGIRAEAARKIYNAAKKFGIEVSEDDAVMQYVGKSKAADKLTYQEEKNLPDSVFAVVYKDPRTGEKVRKYPLPDKDHVQAAIRYWARYYKEVPPEIRPRAARKIYQRAKELGVEVEEESILRYVGQTNAKKAAEYIDYLLSVPAIKKRREWVINLRVAQNRILSGDQEKVAEALETAHAIEAMSGFIDYPMKSKGPDIFQYSNEFYPTKWAEVDVSGVMTNVAEIHKVLDEQDLSGKLTPQLIDRLRSASNDETLQDIINEIDDAAKDVLKNAILEYRALNPSLEV